MLRMQAPHTIAIISDDDDFAIPMAEHVQHELSLPVQRCQPQTLPVGTLLVLATAPLDEVVQAPVVLYSPPVRVQNVLADIRHALSGRTTELPQQIRFDGRNKTLTHLPTGKETDLTEKEVQLLQAIISAGTKGIRREELLRQVWGVNPELDTHTLETHIYRLRSKFKELNGNQGIEATEGGYGLEM